MTLEQKLAALEAWTVEVSERLGLVPPIPEEERTPPCGGSRCFRSDFDGAWIHSSKSYGTCAVNARDEESR